MTIREALRLAAARLEQAGVPDADVDAAYLLASVLKEDTLAMRQTCGAACGMFFTCRAGDWGN